MAYVCLNLACPYVQHEIPLCPYQTPGGSRRLTGTEVDLIRRRMHQQGARIPTSPPHRRWWLWLLVVYVVVLLLVVLL